MTLESKSNFLLGLVIGTISGFAAAGIYFKKKYYTLMKEEKEDLEEYYCRSYEYYKGEKGAKEQKDAPLEGGEECPNQDEIKKKWTDKTDYASCYKKALNEGEDEQKEREKEYENQMSSEEIMNDFYEETNERPPTLLSYEEVEKLPDLVDRVELTYYAIDEVIVSDVGGVMEEVVSDPEPLIGNVILDSKFFEDDEEEIYVMNYRLATLYHIEKVMECWEK